jgi:CitB family two-component system response regulator MalR
MDQKKNILLVDDDRVANFLSERIISAMGIAKEVQSVTNGREALKILNHPGETPAFTPDVILLDLNMPIMNGFEFIQAFHEMNHPQKDRMIIIAVTSSNNIKDIEKAREFGIKHYLTKPISPESVKAIILEGNEVPGSMS